MFEKIDEVTGKVVLKNILNKHKLTSFEIEQELNMLEMYPD